MSNALFEKGREGFLGPASGQINWANDTIKAVLVDLNDIAKTVTGATNATPIVVTATAHGFSNGDVVMISGVLGNTAANGRFRIANVTTNTFELTSYAAGANVAGNGSYTSGGLAYNLTVNDNLDDITAGARIATSSALASKTVTNGVADAADVTWSAVSGDPSEVVIIYKDTGVESTSRLIAYIDTATGLPVTPNGGDITVAWDNGQNRIFML